MATQASPAHDLTVDTLLETATLAIRDMRCGGACRHRSPAECSTATHLVYPYRGVFMRHVGSAETVAEANQLVFFNDDEDYSISHPVDGGDACLSISIDQALLHEMAPPEQLASRATVTFRDAKRGIDAQAQATAALLRHGLARGAIEPLAAEALALDLIQRSLGARTSHAKATSYGRRKLADRAKLLLATEPGRRWTLAEIAGAVGVSPVYLTQVFTQAEGIPLYRYQLRQRLARALDLLEDCDDLTALALDLGFSSHSHFTAAFRQTFGRSPAAYQAEAGLRGIDRALRTSRAPRR